MYHKAMFDRAGVSYREETWTWDDMVRLAKQLTIRDDQEGARVNSGSGSEPTIYRVV